MYKNLVIATKFTKVDKGQLCLTSSGLDDSLPDSAVPLYCCLDTNS